MHISELRNFVEMADSYSSREPEHPTEVAVLSKATTRSQERGLREEVYMVSLKGSGGPHSALTIHEGCNPKEGLNGYLTEDLVAILVHVTQRYQESKFKNPENAKILEHYKAIQDLMLRRRLKRQARGVSGTRKV